ncbi:sigma-54-dependent Fis family transcriptional regulator [candidate division KSB1 bacterium]|nr:sigma-54-dependent Fis family transcriptional regulator [candidate division KSB1 bacterium]
MDDKKTILLIDDETDIHTICKKYADTHGYHLVSAFNGEEGFNFLNMMNVDLILLDCYMPVMNGFSFYKELIDNKSYAKFRHIPVIVLTVIGNGNDKMQELLSLGVTLYLQKPFGFKELMNIISNIFMKDDPSLNPLRDKSDNNNLLEENTKLRSQIQELFQFENLIGITGKMRKIFTKIKDFSRTDHNILISGEIGTGKEFLARTIHANSARKNNAFVVLDCKNIPATIVESELKGYNNGAFTENTQAKIGLLKKANHGTLFINEVCELDIKIQQLLVDVLKNRKFTPMGSSIAEKTDIRLICATTYDPEKEMMNNRLKEDFYYRISVISFKIPALRERIEDVPYLADHFLRRYCNLNQLGRIKLTSKAVACMKNYYWPGNIDELQTLMERLVSQSDKSHIRISDLPSELRESHQIRSDILSSNLPLKQARKKWIERFERNYLINLLTSCNGNISKVARTAQVNRMTIYRMLNYYNIKSKKNPVEF